MPLRIDRVDTEIEVTRQEAEGASPPAGLSSIGFDDLNTIRGRTALREKLRPIVMEILNDELMRIKRKVGAP